MQTARGASLSDPDPRKRAGRRLVGVVLAIAAGVLVLDQGTKAAAESALSDGRVVQVVDGLLQLRLVYNPGAAFSLATNATILLSLVSIGVVVVILRISRRLTSVAWAVALGALLGGALGNLTDRLLRAPGPLRGEVVDFLELPNWPVFNLADSAIVGSALLMVVLSLRGIPYDAGVAGRPAGPDPGAGVAGDDRRPGEAADGDRPRAGDPAGREPGA
jgi:signal peptidase II